MMWQKYFHKESCLRGAPIRRGYPLVARVLEGASMYISHAGHLIPAKDDKTVLAQETKSFSGGHGTVRFHHVPHNNHPVIELDRVINLGHFGEVCNPGKR